MCVIVYKPAGTSMPSTDTLKACVRANPDGCGLMWAGDGSVHVRKGLMTYEDLVGAIEKVPNVERVALVIHARIGTQGPNDASMCHPFPVTHDDGLLVAQSVRCRVALAHNGILSLTNDRTAKVSDTYLFVRDYATHIIRGRADWHEDEHAHALMTRLTAGSRVAVMDGNGHVELLGNWTQRPDGCHYSNTIWSVPRTTYMDDDRWCDGSWHKGRGYTQQTLSGFGNGKNKRRGSAKDAPTAPRKGTRDGVEVLMAMPSDLFVYDSAADVLVPVPGSGFVSDRLGRVYKLERGHVELYPDAEFWDEACMAWVPASGTKSGWVRMYVGGKAKAHR